jgi:hypothetical protein
VTLPDSLNIGSSTHEPPGGDPALLPLTTLMLER